MKLTPTGAPSDATVKVGKQGTTLATVARDSASAAIALDVGTSAIVVEVTLKSDVNDEATYTVTYTVTVTRPPPPVTTTDDDSPPPTTTSGDPPSGGEAPEVSLSASPNPVAEGSSVTVTAALSRALSNAVTIPVTVTQGTAESDDHGTLASITVSAGATSGTGTITTAQDADSDDETFTVALGSLPPAVTAGSPSSVQVTIRRAPRRRGNVCDPEDADAARGAGVWRKHAAGAARGAAACRGRRAGDGDGSAGRRGAFGWDDGDARTVGHGHGGREWRLHAVEQTNRDRRGRDERVWRR